jgi:hypothetical protein
MAEEVGSFPFFIVNALRAMPAAIKVAFKICSENFTF